MIGLRPLVGASAAAVLLAGLVLAAGLPAGADTSSGRTATVVATRSYLGANGKAHTVDTRRVRLSVSETTNLRGRQELTVNWTGAHPTGGAVADINSADGANEEYPFVLLECRGIDSSAAPRTKRLSPETCWTQTWSERFQSDNTTGYPDWRLDRYATTAERAKSVDAPTPRPAACFRAALAERWVPFTSADGTDYPGGSVGCAGMAPESANVGGSGIPSNTTYGITGTDGTGSAQFDVWTSDENASLGCSSTVACALVAVPVMGVSCDAYGTRLPLKDRPDAEAATVADTTCRAADAYRPGQLADPGITPNPALTGSLWWSASNWRNRITVPLAFATPASICSIVSNGKPLAVYGSILMNEATAQWEPKFCTDKSLFPFVHVQTADSAARTLLDAGNIDVGFSSQAPPGGFTRPVVQAPVALSGFAITYAIDDANGNRYTSLRLDARLLAKLLTQSYPANSLVHDNYPALADNPMNITRDPEFIALNPGLPSYASTEAAATLLTLSTEADLIWSLTSYLNADPEARAWLNGAPDPWGMVVNPNYKSISLPVESWPLLDGFTLPQSYIDQGNNPCYSYSPSPYLALIANPTAFISTIVQNIQFAISNVDIACPNGDPSDVSTLRLSVQGRQQPGFRFVLGVTPLSAARRYDLLTAALQTSADGPDGTFDDASGRTFVSADDHGLRAAAAIFRADSKAKTWSLPYNVLHTSSGNNAYPGTMLIFADAPTSGLDASTASRVARLLRYADAGGQHPGLANGQLPPGYLPLSAGNGLGELSAYTARAADAVAAQAGTVPPLVAPPTVPTHTATPSGTSSTSVSGAPSTAAVPTSGGTAPTSLAAAPVATRPSGHSTTTASLRSHTPASQSSGTRAPAAAVSSSPSHLAARTVGATSDLGKFAVPMLGVAGLLAALIGGLLRYPTGVAAGAHTVARLARGGRRRASRTGSHR